MKRVAIAGFLIGLAILLWWQSSSPPEDPPANPGRTESPVMTAEDEGAADPIVPAEDRTAMEGKAAEPMPSDEDLELLEGIVVARQGQPIPDAEVELRHQAYQAWRFTARTGDLPPPKLLARTRTGPEGTFAFPVPRVRTFVLDVRADGYSSDRVFYASPGQHHRIVLDEEATIEGFVRLAESQLPLAGTEVFVLRQPGIPGHPQQGIPTPVASVFADAQGHYRIGQLPPERHWIRVWTTEGVDAHQEIVLEAGQVYHVDFDIERTGRVFGTVRDSRTGSPIAGAQVSTSSTSFVTTDESGEFELFGAGNAVIFRAPGYHRWITVLEEDAASSSLDVELSPGGAVQGRFVDGKGDSVPGVDVVAMSRGGSTIELYPDWLVASSGTDGRFFINGLDPRHWYHLFARHPAHGALLYLFPERARPEVPVDLGDLELPPASVVRGRVVEDSGAGLQAMVELAEPPPHPELLRFAPQDLPEDVPEAPALRGQTVFTDSGGRFQFVGLWPGEYRLRGVLMDRQNFRTSFTIDEWGQMIDDLEIKVAAGLPVRGRVVTSTGEPPGLEVSIFIFNRPLNISRSLIIPAGETSFEFPRLAPGTYRITAHMTPDEDHPWIHALREGIEAGSSDVEVELRSVDWIEGRILDAQGDPAAGASVLAVGTGRNAPLFRTSDTSGEDGTFRIAVGQGEVVEVRASLGRTMVPVPGVLAGTRDLVIRMR